MLQKFGGLTKQGGLGGMSESSLSWWVFETQELLLDLSKGGTWAEGPVSPWGSKMMRPQPPRSISLAIASAVHSAQPSPSLRGCEGSSK